MEQEQDYEDYLGNENKIYTQSYTGPTEDEYPWEEEEEEGEGKKEKKGLTEEEKKKLEEEEEEERKRKIKEINQKTKERADARIRVPARLHAGMEGVLGRWPHLPTAPCDHIYKHQKGGKGKKGEGKKTEGKAKAAAPKERAASAGFEPRDEEDREYWEKTDKYSEELQQQNSGRKKKRHGKSTQGRYLRKPQQNRRDETKRKQQQKS